MTRKKGEVSTWTAIEAAAAAIIVNAEDVETIKSLARGILSLVGTRDKRGDRKDPSRKKKPTRK